MQSISGLGPGGARPFAPAAGAKGPAEAGERGEEKKGLRKPVMDEYVPEEKREPSGRCWLGRGGDGRPKVCFDAPGREAGGSEKAARPSSGPVDEDGGKAAEPERMRPDGGEERCTGSTDRVDREIARLKKRKQELERQVRAETDEAKARGLEAELRQVEGELRQKDNDAYRRQHTEFSQRG